MATNEQTAFIKLLGEPAQKEFAQSNIFPSLVIAQGILESGWGKSELAKNSNNLFGRRGTYKGESVQGGDKDIDKDGNATSVVVPFRKYPSIAESIQDHIESLLTSETKVNGKTVKRYQRVIDAKTYQAGAQALYDCGYAGDRDYPGKLTTIVDKYKLYEWDKKNAPAEQTKPVEQPKPIEQPKPPVVEPVKEPVKEIPKEPVKDTNTYHTVKSGDTVSALAKKYTSTLANIKSWNKLNDKYTIYIGQRLRVK